MNGDTNENKDTLFRHEFLGGPLGNGSGQQEALCYMFPELLALKNLGVDLGKTGIIKGLTAFGNVIAVPAETPNERLLIIEELFEAGIITQNQGTFDLLQVVADPLDEEGKDTLDSFTNLYNSYKASFCLADTEEIILPGLAGSGIFKNNPLLCAAAAILAAHNTGKQLDIYGVNPEEMKFVIDIANSTDLNLETVFTLIGATQ